MNAPRINRCVIGLLLISLALPLIGCTPSTSRQSQPPAEDSTATPSDQPLRVLAIDSSDLATAIRRQWLAHSQTMIEIQETSSDEFLSADPKSHQADVVIFPTVMLGHLASSRQIVPWSMGQATNQEESTAPRASNAEPIEDDYGWNDVFPLLRREELRWGDQIYGVPFGSPQLMLVYRADLLQAWQIPVPRTWEEYADAVEQMTGRLKQDQAAAGDSAGSGPQVATVEPLGETWAARTFLARAAAYARHPNQYSTLFQFATLEPWIDQPPFVRALEELAAVTRSMPTSARSRTPAEAMSMLLSGQAVMAMTWPSAAHKDVTDLPTDARFGIAVLPGSTEVYQVSNRTWQPHRASNGTADQVTVVSTPLLGASGRIGAVARRAQSVEAARSFLIWLTRAEQAARISGASDSTTLFRDASADQPGSWVETPLRPIAGEFAKAMRANQQSVQALPLLRIPGQERYLAVLDEAVRRVIQGESTATESLEAAAEQWKEITETQGLAAQQAAYLKSLGLNL